MDERANKILFKNSGTSHRLAPHTSGFSQRMQSLDGTSAGFNTPATSSIHTGLEKAAATVQKTAQTTFPSSVLHEPRLNACLAPMLSPHSKIDLPGYNSAAIANPNTPKGWPKRSVGPPI